MTRVLEAIDSDEYFHDTDYEILGNQDTYGVFENAAYSFDASDMTVDLAAGYTIFDGGLVEVSVNANALTLVSDGSNERWSYLTTDSSGSAVLVSGDAAADGSTEPTKPELGDRNIHSMVKIQAGQTIANNCEQKLDKRMLVRQALNKGGDLTAAGTMTPTHRYHDVAGATTITGLGNTPAGWRVLLQFDGTPQLTHSDPGLALIGQTNATMVAKEFREFVSEGSGNHREVPLVPKDLVDGGATTLHSHANTETFPIWAQPHHQTNTGTHPTAEGDYGTTSIGDASNAGTAYFSIPFPTGFVTLTKAVVRVISKETGNLRWSVATDFAAVGEASTANSDSIAEATLGVTADAMADLDIAAAMTGVAAGDTMGVQLVRNGASGSDTITTLHVIGVLVEYTQ